MKPLRTLTRKSIKPRKLFQTQSQVDEEIETEIDEDDVEAQQLASPTRATRSRAVIEFPTAEITGAKRKRGSPFDKWPRLKSGSGSRSASTSGPAPRGRKRNAAEALEV